MPRLEDKLQQVGSNIAFSVFHDALHAFSGVSYLWSCSMSTWNKLMHIVFGNMGKSNKGKGQTPAKGGKGKGQMSGLTEPIEVGQGSSPVAVVDASQDVAVAVRPVLPEAARVRMQSTLLQSEWHVPVHIPQTLSSRGGVALVPKDLIADVVARVGYTANPVAMVVTQDPDLLGLRGYVRHRVRCGISVMGADGERTETQVERFLVQLGFGDPVEQRIIALEIPFMTTMVKMTVKFPERHGWPHGPHPASVVVDQLARYVPEPAIADVVPRDGPSAAFLLHTDYLDVALKNSGKNGVFIKTRGGPELELLWLDDGFDFPGALRLAVHDTCYGVIEKGGSFQPRYAIRFRDLPALRAFAAANNITDLSSLGRWKVSGIMAIAGTHGVAALLHSLKWLDVQILYVTEGHAVYLASNRGFDDRAFFLSEGAPRQLTFKALNAQARGMVRDGAARSSVSGTVPLPVRALSVHRRAQDSFLAQVFPERNQQSGDNNGNTTPEAKREAPGPTGETPDPQRRREM